MSEALEPDHVKDLEELMLPEGVAIVQKDLDGIENLLFLGRREQGRASVAILHRYQSRNKGELLPIFDKVEELVVCLLLFHIYVMPFLLALLDLMLHLLGVVVVILAPDGVNLLFNEDGLVELDLFHDFD